LERCGGKKSRLGWYTHVKMALKVDLRPAFDHLEQEQCRKASVCMAEDKVLTVDLSTRGAHEVGGQIWLFESDQAAFARRKDAIMVTNGCGPHGSDFEALF
jgi:hypothetical protein